MSKIGMRKMLKGGVGLNERWRALLRRTVIPTACAKKRRGGKKKVDENRVRLC